MKYSLLSVHEDNLQNLPSEVVALINSAPETTQVEKILGQTLLVIHATQARGEITQELGDTLSSCLGMLSDSITPSPDFNRVIRWRDIMVEVSHKMSLLAAETLPTVQ